MFIYEEQVQCSIRVMVISARVKYASACESQDTVSPISIMELAEYLLPNSAWVTLVTEFCFLIKTSRHASKNVYC